MDFPQQNPPDLIEESKIQAPDFDQNQKNFDRKSKQINSFLPVARNRREPMEPNFQIVENQDLPQIFEIETSSAEAGQLF